MTQAEEFSLHGHLRLWWKARRLQSGWFSTIRGFLRILWDFAIDSLPERRRSRYGDADYDWDYRVNTTSGSLTRHERFLGMLHSPYQPTDPALFHEILQALLKSTRIDLQKFTFLDVGSGKGRTLLMASDYPFRRIVGVELLPTLHQAAQKNIAAYRSDKQQCFALEPVCADASRFEFAPEPTVLYLFNPLPEYELARMLENLQGSLERLPRDLFLLYHNPLLESQVAMQPWLEKITGTQQFAIYRFRGSGDSQK
jgi:SAM-dependent methyltransferase